MAEFGWRNGKVVAIEPGTVVRDDRTGEDVILSDVSAVYAAGVYYVTPVIFRWLEANLVRKDT